MRIRHSRDDETNLLYELHRRAFGDPEGATVAQLAIDLLLDPSATPLLSLVAMEGDDLLGHIIFSTVAIDGDLSTGTYILSPLAVEPARQSTGIGRQLIGRGLARLQEQNGQCVLVLGNPNYYSKSGFHNRHQLVAPYELAYPEAWMAQELQAGALDRIKGKVTCADVLNAPEHW